MNKIRLKESDIERLVNKIIKEQNINEVGGYDDPFQMSKHEGGYIREVATKLFGITDLLLDLDDLQKEEVFDDKLRSKLKSFVSEMTPKLKDMVDSFGGDANRLHNRGQKWGDN